MPCFHQASISIGKKDKKPPKYLTDNSLHDMYQSGFRVNHSIITALLRVSNDLRICTHNYELSILVLLLSVQRLKHFKLNMFFIPYEVLQGSLPGPLLVMHDSSWNLN